MPSQRIQTPHAPQPVGPYSQAILAGETLYVAGQGPINPETGQVVHGTFEEQAHLTFRNVQAILEAAGFTLGDVVKVTTYLAELGDFSAYNEIYRQYFSEPYPARATVGCQLLMHTFIEVECIAVRG